MASGPTPSKDRTTVFFDGACPLCRAEIRFYERRDLEGVLSFVDVSRPDAGLPEDLGRDKALARFHVLSADGRLLSGAAAFAEVWRRTPGWRWAWRLSSVPGVMVLLETGYRLFLRFRPAIVRLFVVTQRLRRAPRSPSRKGAGP